MSWVVHFLNNSQLRQWDHRKADHSLWESLLYRQAVVVSLKTTGLFCCVLLWRQGENTAGTRARWIIYSDHCQPRMGQNTHAVILSNGSSCQILSVHVWQGFAHLIHLMSVIKLCFPQFVWVNKCRHLICLLQKVHLKPVLGSGDKYLSQPTQPSAA